MNHRFWLLVLSSVLLGAGAAFAFSPPTDKQEGVTLSIEGFPEQSDNERVAVRKEIGRAHV